MYYVYRVTNVVDGKTYVGKRKFDDDPRDDDYLGSGRMLNGIRDRGNGAIAKYGRKNFRKEILIGGLDAETAAIEELRVILEEKAKGKCEYNIAVTYFGGDVCKGRVRVSKGNHTLSVFPDEVEALEGEGYKRGMSDGFKEKISRSSRGRKQPPNFGPEQSVKMKAWWANASEETKKRIGEKISKTNANREPNLEAVAKSTAKIREYYATHRQWNYGKTGVYSDETRAAMGVKNRGRSFTEEQRRKMGKERRGKALSEEHKEKLRKPKVSHRGLKAKNNNGRTSRVRCVDTGEVFSSIEEARKVYPSCNHIGDVCRGLRYQTGGLRWEYFSENLLI